VWVFISDSGGVQRTRIHQSVEVDVDMAVVKKAYAFRCKAAVANGRPVPAWIVLPVLDKIVRAPPSASCG
jgi:hypothetical protein